MQRRTSALAAVTLAALGLTTIGVPAATAAEPTHLIADVQGDAAATPVDGAVVTVEGVVTGDYRAATGSGYRGFYLQDANSGGDTDPTPGRSDGIFVFASNADPAVAIGDLVRVTGTAGEYFDQTQLTATSDGAYELVTADVGVPEPTVLPASVIGDAREAFEGMLVAPADAHLSSTHQSYSFGSLWLDVGDPAVKATETTDAGDAALAIAATNKAERILVDDGYSIRVDNSAHPGSQPYLTEDVVVRNGDHFVSPEAGMILGWGFDDWRLQPQRPLSDTSPTELAALEPTWETANPRTDAPEDVGGDFSVAAFNVFNYFTTFGGDARGADNAEEFLVQQSKIVSAINTLDADIVALMEIENSVKFGEPVDEALGALVDALNAAAGAGTWDYVATPTELHDPAITDFITNAIIYKPAEVTTVGESFAHVDETVWDIAREPIAQTFDVDGKIITVVANHFKSKSPPDVDPTPPDPADLQGHFNAERVEQATALAGFVDTIAADPQKSEDVVLLGDFNAYHEEDPIQALTDAGYVDLVPEHTDEYTYTFDGELGSLDHAIVTPSLADYITGVDVWGINSAEWGDRAYPFGATEAGTPFRSSDHDPIKVGLSAEVAPVEIEILSINDFHGRLEADGDAAGAAVMGGMVDAFRADNPNTLFVGAGDLIGASTFTSFIQDDVPTIEAFNAMGLDASAFGNHEFDQGRDDVDNRVLDLADWDYLSANIYDRATDQPAYQEYYLQDFDGVTVGFIGAMTEELPSLVSPDGIASLEVKPVVPEVNRVADQLSDDDPSNGEADVLVLLVHEGAASTDIADATDDSPFGEIVTGANEHIDAIVSGHTHLAYDHEIPIPGTDEVRPVVSSGQYGEMFSHMDVSVDADTGDLVSISAEVLPLAGAYPPNDTVAGIVADAVAIAEVLGAVKVGEITADLDRAVQATGAENRGAESTLGNFVADVQLWATQDAGSELAFMNPGGLRADLNFAGTTAEDPDGNVTYAEAAAVQPFANTLVTMELTGAQIAQVLEEQWQPAEASRPFLRLGTSSNFEYAYDPAAPAGERIGAMYLDGVPVEADATYTVTANSFLAAGGDNFATLGEGANPADSGKIDLQSMVDYFEAFPVVSPDFAQHAIGVTLSENSYSAGDEVTLDLSSLLMTDGPQQATAVVSAGGTELGSAPIDPAIVGVFDEQGQATVTVTIPEGTPEGTFVLTVSVPENGTSVDVPIEISSSAEAIEVVKQPKITGAAKVGHTLKVNEGKWSVKKPEFGYQWNRDGVPIDGATDERYTVVAADIGTDLTVTVTASAEGYADGVATTEGKTVPKLRSSISGEASRFIVWGDAELEYTVDVRARGGGETGVVPTGGVSIYDGRELIATVVLEAADEGEATVSLPDLGRGIHLLTARYEGNDQLTASTSWPDLVLVF